MFFGDSCGISDMERIMTLEPSARATVLIALCNDNDNNNDVAPALANDDGIAPALANDNGIAPALANDDGVAPALANDDDVAPALANDDDSNEAATGSLGSISQEVPAVDSNDTTLNSLESAGSRAYWHAT